MFLVFKIFKDKRKAVLRVFCFYYLDSSICVWMFVLFLDCFRGFFLIRWCILVDFILVWILEFGVIWVECWYGGDLVCYFIEIFYIFFMFFIFVFIFRDDLKIFVRDNLDERGCLLWGIIRIFEWLLGLIIINRWKELLGVEL